MIPYAANATATLQRRLQMLLNGLDNPRKLPLLSGGSAPPSNTWFHRPTRVFLQDGISIGSAVFAQLTVECPYTVQWTAMFSPQNCPFPLGDRVSVVLRPPQSSSQTASRSVQPFLYGSKCYAAKYIVNGEESPQNCPFSLGLRHPSRGGPSYGHRQRAQEIW